MRVFAFLAVIARRIGPPLRPGQWAAVRASAITLETCLFEPTSRNSEASLGR